MKKTNTVTMTAAILGVGTELTSGQIFNSNARWISEQLKRLGVETLYHLTVPDDRKLILESLRLMQNYDFIFVTGGLGPTTDDFTRDIIADWAGKKMVFDQASYYHIENRLKSRGVPVRDSQKQQCYYPEGSQVLFNQNGTANGFYFEHGKTKTFVLPGPPREISGIWQDHIDSMMKDFCKNIDATVTESWDCLGLGESEIAHLTETALAGCDFEKGFRVHIPYVEVKFTYRKSREIEAKSWIAKVEGALAPHTVARNGEDLGQKTFLRLERFSKICICDNYLQSFIHSRLDKFGRNLLTQNKLVFVFDKHDIPKDCDAVIIIHNDRKHFLSLNVALDGKIKDFNFESPSWLHFSEEREKQYFTEQVFLNLSKT